MSREHVLKINGRVVSRQEFDRHEVDLLKLGPMGYAPSAYSDQRPGGSLAMGCHRKEIASLNERIQQEGIVGIHYEPDKHGGKCVITNNSKRTGRRKWMKIFGEMAGLGRLVDENSFD